MKIQLPELDVISCNGSWTGLILKKHLTFDEARFIAASALGVNMDLLLDDWWARSIDGEGGNYLEYTIQYVADYCVDYYTSWIPGDNPEFWG